MEITIIFPPKIASSVSVISLDTTTSPQIKSSDLALAIAPTALGLMFEYFDFWDKPARFLGKFIWDIFGTKHFTTFLGIFWDNMLRNLLSFILNLAQFNLTVLRFIIGTFHSII
ncbi:hypothetical protein [Crucivirus-539]|nr:hypothetical protein [Crucivirus-539]